MILLTLWPSGTLCQTTAAWHVSHHGRPRCPKCSPPAWPPASCGWYQDSQCRFWRYQQGQLFSFQWSLHSQPSLENSHLRSLLLNFPKETIQRQVWPDLASLTRLKMVPGFPLMLKHRASRLSGSIMKWGSPSTTKSYKCNESKVTVV